MKNYSSIKEEIYTHQYLWKSSSLLLQHAKEHKEGSLYFFLPSLLMSFMAYEAFVNFIGFILLPELWKEEKKHFKGKGTEGKLEKIIEQLPDFYWEKEKPPYQNIKKLEKFRDSVSHGKVVLNEGIVERKKDGAHFTFEHDWDIFLSVDEIENARDDIKFFCQSLLVEIRKKSEHLQIKFAAFEQSFTAATGKSV